MERVNTVIRQIDKATLAATNHAMNEAGKDLSRDFQKVSSNWKHKVAFGETTIFNRDEIIVRVTPNGKNAKLWGYIDLGTGKWGKSHAPYPIPKIVIPGKFLRFRTGYSARTAPVARYNVGTGMATGGWISKQQVIHPGIEPRKFSEDMADKLTPALHERVQSEINRTV